MLYTILAAIVIMLIVVALLGIGWLITGKSRLKKGCGQVPGKKGKKECDLCGKPEECEREKKEP